MEQVVLGIDPGFSITGYAVTIQEGQQVKLIDCGYLKMNTKDELKWRVERFHSIFTEKIINNHVTHVALETSFLGKNAQVFLKLGYLRGIVYLLAAKHNLIVLEYAPKQVKMAVTGFGSAGKDQVASMVMRLFPRIKSIVTIDKYDLTDAIAVSLCGVWQKTNHSI